MNASGLVCFVGHRSSQTYRAKAMGAVEKRARVRVVRLMPAAKEEWPLVWELDVMMLYLVQQRVVRTA